ncbi:MAG: amidase [Microthrixaceae bacterium]|nr:amidase [Microthrixaceae bacterium]
MDASAPDASPRRCWTGADDALGDLDAVGIAEQIASGATTAAEAVEASIARAEAAEADLAAFVETDFDRARERANDAVPGRFAGLPTAIKDQTAVEGLTLRFGSNSLAQRAPSTASSPITKIFESIGTVAIGTTSLPEFGLTSSSDFPGRNPTRNPWNLDHTTGGSSSGAGALVAAGVLPMAHGGDGGGSIRIPAAACGLVGLKPSGGRLPHENDEAGLPVKISAYGVLTRTVRDQCAFFAAAEEAYSQNRLPPIGLVDRPNSRPLRIGVLPSSPINRTPAASVAEALNSTAALLESVGHHVDVIDEVDDVITETFADDFILYWAFLASVLEVRGKKIVDPSFDASGLTPFTRGLARHAKRNAVRIPGSIRRLRRLHATYDKHLGARDLIVSPTVSDPAPQLGHLGRDLDYETHLDRLAKWAAYTPLHNAVGAPAISLPLGYDTNLGLPVGIHFASRVGQERLLLELALQVEEAAPFRHLGG